jgi:hypothetical protein
MSYRGRVKNGVVVFDEPVQLADGTEVRIEPIGGDEGLPRVGPTLLEQLGDLVGSVPDLPPDMADQHDHYVHGSPKR